MLGVLRLGANRIGVPEGPQVVDTVELAAVNPQPPHVRPGGQQRLAEPDLVARLQLRDALVGVEARYRRPRHQLDVLLAPPLIRTEQDVLARLLAPEVLLRQLGAVVRRIRLAADEEDRAVGAGLAQPARTVAGR